MAAQPMTGQSLAPLTIRRDAALFARWWRTDADRQAITDALENLTQTGELEWRLSSLMSEVFQTGEQPPVFLCVTGLRPGTEVCYICLDLEPARDGEGLIDGVEAVLSLFTAADVSLLVSAYTGHAAALFVPQHGADAFAILGEIIDTALALVNAEIADRDRFMVRARAVHPRWPDTSVCDECGAATGSLVGLDHGPGCSLHSANIID